MFGGDTKTEMQNIFCKKNIIFSVILLLYAVFTLCLVFQHEIWADEAQAWLVARDLDFLGLIRHVRIEGHPLLWYFLLLPLAKLNLPVFSMQILNWAVVVVSLGILLFRAPFSIYLKTAIVLSSGFLYWYPAMARSYCLIPLLMFVIAIFYEKRHERPFLYASLLILLANTHVIIFGFCAALALIFAYESFERKSKKSAIASFAILFSLLCVFLYIYGTQNENIIVAANRPSIYPLPFLQVTFQLVLVFFGIKNWYLIILFVVFLIYFAIFFYIKDKKLFFVYTLNLLCQYTIYCTVWGIIPQRAYTFAWVCLFCLWVLIANRKSLKQNMHIPFVLLFFVFISTIPHGYNLCESDFKYPYSGGKETAQFIKNNIPKDAFIITNAPLSTPCISAYLPKDGWKIYYDGYKTFYTFSIWDKMFPDISAPVPYMKFLLEHKEIYILLAVESFVDIKPLFVTDDNVILTQERFKIYKIRRVN